MDAAFRNAPGLARARWEGHLVRADRLLPASNTPEILLTPAVSGGSAGSVLARHSQGVVGMKGLRLSTSGPASLVISKQQKMSSG